VNELEDDMTDIALDTEIQELSVPEQAIELIDWFLDDIRSRQLVSSDQISDVLLDLRILLSVN